MSNYNFAPTLDGLNNVDGNSINSNTVITDYLTVNISSSVPTLPPSTNNNSIASTAFVNNAVSSIPVISNYVTTNTNQTISGLKDFVVLPTSSSLVTLSNQLTTKDYVDNGVFVNLTSNQNISGIKTFNNNLVVGAGINNNTGSNLTLTSTGGNDISANSSNDIIFNSTYNTVLNAGAYGSFSSGVGFNIVNNGSAGLLLNDNASAGGQGIKLTSSLNDVINTSVNNYDYNTASIFSPAYAQPNRGAIYNSSSSAINPNFSFTNGQAVDIGVAFTALTVSVPIGNTSTIIKASIPFDLLAWATFGLPLGTGNIGLQFDSFTVTYLKNGSAYTPTYNYSTSPAIGTVINWSKSGTQSNIGGMGAYFGNLEITFSIDTNNTSTDSYQVRVTPQATITNYSINFDNFKFVCRSALGSQTNGNGFKTTSVTAYTGGTLTFLGGNPSFVDTSITKISFSYPVPASSNYCFMPLNNNITPAGMVSAFIMATAPAGWLYCNGASVSITTYPNLFNAIGFTYGGSFASGNFFLPDFRAMFLRSAESKTVGGVTYTAPAVGPTVQQDAVLNPLYCSNQGYFNVDAAGGGANRQLIPRSRIGTDPVDTGTGILARFDRTASENRPINMSVYYHIKF